MPAPTTAHSHPLSLHPSPAPHAGPDALVGRIPGETVHSARLLDLCTQCHLSGEVLVCSIPAADVVLVPRQPSAAAVDGLYFIAYATNVRAVTLCESLRSKRQVAVVLDIDNTLIDATPVGAISEEDWDALDWITTTVESSSGRRIEAQLAHLPGSEASDPTQERAFLIHWRVGRMACTFKVRVRRGWASFRDYLAANADKHAAFVCSKGKKEYVQLIWLGLDPEGALLPRSAWGERLTSTFPDTLVRAAQKTALVALGCADVTCPAPPTQVAAPVVFVDDSPEAYDPAYSDSILYVEEYRPSDGVHSDRGSVMRQVAARLDAYWAATCGEAGTFAWQAAQSFATAILGAMQRSPMESPNALAYLQIRCNKQGLALWHQVTLASVFTNDVYVADSEAGLSSEGGVGGMSHAVAPPLPPPSLLAAAPRGLVRSRSGGDGGPEDPLLHPWLREAAAQAAEVRRAEMLRAKDTAAASARPQAMAAQARGRPIVPPGAALPGASASAVVKVDEGGHSPDDVLHAALMLKC